MSLHLNPGHIRSFKKHGETGREPIMDSMRSLNTSLPSSSSTRPAPPEQLLQAFRNAALSVTNLYKSAVTDQSNSRQAGYQEALEDLLGFLDRENLGLQDGEGWRVRQWATERYDGSAHQQASDSDDEAGEVEQRPRSISPIRKQPNERMTTPVEPVKVESATQTEDIQTSTTQEHTPATPVFQFSGHSVPAGPDQMLTDDDGNGTNPDSVEPSASTSTSATAPIRLEVVNTRGSRTPHRHTNQRHGVRPANREFTFTAGSKRKIQFPDFFNISDFGPRDGLGSSNRGRLS